MALTITRGLTVMFVVAMIGPLAFVKGQTPTKAPGDPAASSSLPKAPSSLRLSLNDAVRLATENNSGLRSRYLDHLIDKARIREAQGAFDPTLFAEASTGEREVVFPQIFPTGEFGPDGEPTFFQTIVTDRTETGNLQLGLRGKFRTGATYQLSMNTDFQDREAGGLINPSFNTTTRFQVTQPLLRAAWEQYNLGAIAQARLTEGQSRQRFRREVQQKTRDVHSAYWELVFSREDLLVKEESLKLAEKLLEINRVRVRTGTFAPIEIASAESGVANRITDVIVAENALDGAADRLRRLVLPFESHGDWDIGINATETLDDRRVPIPVLKECLSIARMERPDLVESRLDMKTREIGVSLADNETLPKLDITGSYQATGLDLQLGPTIADAFGQEGAQTFNVGLSFEVPLGNQVARSRLSQRRLERDRAVLSYRDLMITTTEEVRAAYRKVLVQHKTIASRRRAEDLKRQEVENEQIKLENKVSTNFQVLQVQEDLALRRSELLRALVDYRVALAELALAMGSSPEVLNWPLGTQ